MDEFNYLDLKGQSNHQPPDAPKPRSHQKSIVSSLAIGSAVKTAVAAAVGLLLASPIVFLIGDRLLTHTLEGDRRRVDDIAKNVTVIASKMHEQEKLMAQGVAVLKTLQLDNNDEVRKLLIDLLGKQAVHDKKVERVIDIFSPLYEKGGYIEQIEQQLESNQTLLPMVVPQSVDPIYKKPSTEKHPIELTTRDSEVLEIHKVKVCTGMVDQCK